MKATRLCCSALHAPIDQRNRRLFGRAFAKNLAELPVQEDWQGRCVQPLAGMRFNSRIERPASPLAFEQVREKVVIDWKQQQRKKANDAYLENLLATYAFSFPRANNNQTSHNAHPNQSLI